MTNDILINQTLLGLYYLVFETRQTINIRKSNISWLQKLYLDKAISHFGTDKLNINKLLKLIYIMFYGFNAYDFVDLLFQKLDYKLYPNPLVGNSLNFISPRSEIKEIAILKEKVISGNEFSEKDNIQKFGDVSLLIKNLDGTDAKTLRTYIDNAKNKLKSGIVVAGSVTEGKVAMAAGVTKDLTDKFHAGNIIKEIATIVGGSGGGRPDMAQAGGTHIEKLDEALKKAEEIIKATS